MTDLALMTARKALRESPGWAIVQRWHIVSRNYWVLESNARELLAFMEAEKERALQAFDANGLPSIDRTQAEIGSKEFDRLFHNFIASTGSLIERMRRVRQRYVNNSDFPSAYQQKVTEVFGNEPDSTFFKKLRNYLLHFDFPDTATSWGVTTTGRTAEPHLLRTTKLLEWDEWSIPERQFIQGFGEHLSLTELIESYLRRSKVLFDWFHEQKAVIHPQEIAEYRHLDAVCNEALRTHMAARQTSAKE